MYFSLFLSIIKLSSVCESVYRSFKFSRTQEFVKYCVILYVFIGVTH